MTDSKEPWGKPKGAPENKDNLEEFKKEQTKRETQQSQEHNNKSSSQNNETQGPPDLESLLSEALSKINGKGKKQSNSSQNSNRQQSSNNSGGNGRENLDMSDILAKLNGKLPNGKLLFPIALLIIIIIYVISGIHTITEGQRGVITRLGKYSTTENPGLNFYFPGVEKLYIVNVEQVKEFSTNGVMLTMDENIVNVGLTVQYRINDPVAYLFNIDNPEESLEEATDSALRLVIGHMSMDDILTTGRAIVRENTRQNLVSIIEPYKLGLSLVDVNFQSARPPEEVKDAFDDAIKAQEDEQRFIREAEAYDRSKEPLARGDAQKAIEAATAYSNNVLLKAQGETSRFLSLLPEYQTNKQVFTTRIYLETMAQIYGTTPKVVAENGMTINFLPLDKLLSPQVANKPNDDSTDNSSIVDPFNIRSTTTTPRVGGK